MHEIVSDLSSKKEFAFEIGSVLLYGDLIVAYALFANLDKLLAKHLHKHFKQGGVAGVNRGDLALFEWCVFERS